MTRSSLRVLSAALVAGLVLSAAAAAPALASEPDLRVVTWDRGADPAADAQVSTGESCAVEAQPLLPGQDPDTLPPAPEVCFGSLEEALEFVSGGDVASSRLADATAAEMEGLVSELNASASSAPTGQRLAGTERATTAAASSLVLGVLWRDANYKGASKVLYGSGTNGCYTGSTYGFPNLANLLMNNVVTSVTTYAGCWVTLYDSYSYAGAKKNCTPHCATLGTFDNKASSVVYRPVGQLG
ncbi:hypothetical protein ACIOWF_16835 [Cellulosimicrobium cellulans]|uniref:SCP domain-containing protein n=1 Tax=Cellulosimicrobium cellulans F16 TaxID=1350482 RepID=A0A0M0F1V9_CELCE|nr:hypothetical protein [Cellulosimicrobium cellulans]KON71539.1 hypothetical protein M768_18410 [Cellulosimicrobium cellulans F16]